MLMEVVHGSRTTLINTFINSMHYSAGLHLHQLYHKMQEVFVASDFCISYFLCINCKEL